MQSHVFYYPQMDSVAQEIAIGFKVLDSYDDEVLCLGHIDDTPIIGPQFCLSLTSKKLMTRVKRSSSMCDIPMHVIDILDAQRHHSDNIVEMMNKKAMWRSLFRSKSTTHIRECVLCNGRKKRRFSSLPPILELADEDIYKAKVPHSKSIKDPTPQSSETRYKTDNKSINNSPRHPKPYHLNAKQSSTSLPSPRVPMSDQSKHHKDQCHPISSSKQEGKFFDSLKTRIEFSSRNTLERKAVYTDILNCKSKSETSTPRSGSRAVRRSFAREFSASQRSNQWKDGKDPRFVQTKKIDIATFEPNPNRQKVQDHQNHHSTNNTKSTNEFYSLEQNTLSKNDSISNSKGEVISKERFIQHNKSNNHVSSYKNSINEFSNSNHLRNCKEKDSMYNYKKESNSEIAFKERKGQNYQNYPLTGYKDFINERCTSAQQPKCENNFEDNDNHDSDEYPESPVSCHSISIQCDYDPEYTDNIPFNTKSIQCNEVRNVPSAGDLILQSSSSRWNEFHRSENTNDVYENKKENPTDEDDYKGVEADDEDSDENVEDNKTHIRQEERNHEDKDVKETSSQRTLLSQKASSTVVHYPLTPKPALLALPCVRREAYEEQYKSNISRYGRVHKSEEHVNEGYFRSPKTRSSKSANVCSSNADDFSRNCENDQSKQLSGKLKDILQRANERAKINAAVDVKTYKRETDFYQGDKKQDLKLGKQVGNTKRNDSDQIEITASRTIVYCTSRPPNNDSSTFNKYLVHRLSIPSFCANSSQISLSTQTELGVRSSRRPKKPTTGNRKVSTAYKFPIIPSAEIAAIPTPVPSITVSTPRKINLHKHKIEKYLTNIRKDPSTGNPGDGHGEVRDFPSTNSNAEGLHQQESETSQKMKDTPSSNHASVRDAWNKYNTPLASTCEPLPRARPHMHPSVNEPVYREKVVYDDELDLTSKDFIEKFFKINRFNN